MTRQKPSAVSVETFADHQIITQPNPLRTMLRRVADDSADDPVARAEAALATLSDEFENWMADEVARLANAYAALSTDCFSDDACEEMFHAAHDIKGDAATFGFPVAGIIADSLCRIIEYAPDLASVPAELLVNHVNAIHAIVREHGRDDHLPIGKELSKRLRAVTDEYLAAVNRDRPEHLEAVLAPGLAPAI